MFVEQTVYLYRYVDVNICFALLYFLYLPDKMSWSSCTSCFINHRLKYNNFVQSFTKSLTTKMFPRRPYSIKSAAFLSHLKSLSDVDEGGFWSSTRFYQFCMHIYTSTKTLCWYYMKNMIMMSIISRIFVSFMFFDYSQSSFMEEKCTINTIFRQNPFQYFSSKVIWTSSISFGILSWNRQPNHAFQLWSIEFKFIF